MAGGDWGLKKGLRGMNIHVLEIKGGKDVCREASPRGVHGEQRGWWWWLGGEVVKGEVR
jgi:hypothetical protein